MEPWKIKWGEVEEDGEEAWGGEEDCDRWAERDNKKDVEERGRKVIGAWKSEEGGGEEARANKAGVQQSER